MGLRLTSSLALILATCAVPVLAQAGDTIEVRPKGADTLVGAYQQPQWTTQRRFTTSRSYVIPEGELGVELWVKGHKYRDGTPNDYLIQQEIEYGLGWHLQLDVYVNQKNYINPETGERMFDSEGQQYEIRWALGDWGKVPLNPALYFEYHPRKNKPEKGEFRVLLSESIAPNWQASANLGYEVELWGEERERELIFTAALSTSSLSDSFSLGLEAKGEWVDTAQNRGSFHSEYLVGPSFQLRPSQQKWFLDIAPLFGIQADAPQIEAWIIAGAQI